MTTAHFNLLVILAFASFAQVSCIGDAAYQSKTVLREQDQLYSEIAHVENSIYDMRKIWEHEKSRQLGEDPDVTLSMSITKMNHLIYIQCYDKFDDLESLSDAEIRCCKKSYMRLIKKYGLVAALLQTGYFSKSDLRAIKAKGDVKVTVLFNELVQ